MYDCKGKFSDELAKALKEKKEKKTPDDLKSNQDTGNQNNSEADPNSDQQYEVKVSIQVPDEILEEAKKDMEIRQNQLISKDKHIEDNNSYLPHQPHLIDKNLKENQSNIKKSNIFNEVTRKELIKNSEEWSNSILNQQLDIINGN